MAIALVVDDSKAVRMILSKMLKEAGYEVLEAGNGWQALEALKTAPAHPRLMLADWNMPEMNGLELVRRVRLKPEMDPMVIVMVTTETEVDQVSAALEAGANEYVMKPFTKEILLGKLQLTGVHA